MKKFINHIYKHNEKLKMHKGVLESGEKILHAD